MVQSFGSYLCKFVSIRGLSSECEEPHGTLQRESEAGGIAYFFHTHPCLIITTNSALLKT